MTDEIPAVRSFRPRRISWLTIVLALLAVGTFIAISGPDVRYYVPAGMGGGVMRTTATSPVMPQSVQVSGGRTSYDEVSVSPQAMRNESGITVSSISSNSKMMPPDVYYYQQGVPATDTREFLKVNYSASMQTRDVPALTRRVETTVRGYDGRIDQENSSPRSGYVSFVVPMSKYEAFRNEVESLVGARFLSINVSSQNLLPQKQSIEEQQKQADDTLATYKADRQRLVNAHTSTVRTLQTQIDADLQALSYWRAQPQTDQTSIQIQTVSNDLSSLQARLSNENAVYASQLKSADSNIKSAESWQTAVQTQDQALLDNVATVSGSISIQWISLWEMAQVYLPGYWIPGIFAVLAFISLLWDRRRFGTV
ncbi:MAG: DUF4349 domain-containing protein [Candidatus Paceibacterota bacterium]